MGVQTMIVDFKATIEAANTWCDNCQSYAKIECTQPYRDYTWRIEIICKNYECEERGIILVMEVKS